MKADTELELQSAPIDPSWILSGTPVARNRVLFNSSDTSGWTMLWDCTAGEFRWQYRVDEIIHFLEGGVIVTDENGTATRYGPGDVACFRAGTAATWRIASGPSVSGKPCPRLTAPCAAARTDIWVKMVVGRPAKTGLSRRDMSGP